MTSKARARNLGIPLEGTPGPYNAITDVSNVEVGLATIIEGKSVRTGVTAIHPRGKTDHDPVFGGTFSFNGNGEMTGAAWVDEGGFVEGPICITNTHSVGMVRDAVIDWQVKNTAMLQRWSCPVVAETADGWLNDMNGFHVKAEHVWQALEGAENGPLAEGNIGGGTGMICYEFKGGTGTASQRLPKKYGGYTVGVLVQANFGRRYQLTVAGVPVGQHITEDALFTNGENPFREQGSLIVILATDAPLFPYQLKRVAKRAALGMARTSSLGGNGSGDIFLAFSTANRGVAYPGPVLSSVEASELGCVQILPNDHLDPIFAAAVLATEEAILNAMLAAETMTGRDGLTVPALPHDLLQNVMRQYNRLSM
ncbi:MAG: P1 family peptidase [Anaerolineales bacterium]|nr:P1 family peptidase [Anaerolineales bacterium]